MWGEEYQQWKLQQTIDANEAEREMERRRRNPLADPFFDAIADGHDLDELIGKGLDPHAVWRENDILQAQVGAYKIKKDEPINLPEDVDQRDLWHRLNRPRARGKSDRKIAKEWSAEKGLRVLNNLQVAKTPKRKPHPITPWKVTYIDDE